MTTSKLVLAFDPEKLTVNKLMAINGYEVLKKSDGLITVYLVDKPKITEMP